jgi:hypothetical protein
MSWDELPAQPVQPAEPAPPTSPRIGGPRKGMLVGAMALTLLAVGGVAAVSAADPSASPAPDATSQPADPGSSAQPDGTDNMKGDCPERDGSGNGSSDDDGSESSPDATPNASDSDV